MLGPRIDYRKETVWMSERDVVKNMTFTDNVSKNKKKNRANSSRGLKHYDVKTVETRREYNRNDTVLNYSRRLDRFYTKAKNNNADSLIFNQNKIHYLLSLTPFAIAVFLDIVMDMDQNNKGRLNRDMIYIQDYNMDGLREGEFDCFDNAIIELIGAEIILPSSDNDFFFVSNDLVVRKNQPF